MFSCELYTIAAHLVPRALGAIYFVVFLPFLFQIRGLIGKNGILPVADFLGRIRLFCGKKSYVVAPTLFWISCSDAALLTVVALGMLCSLLLVFGFAPSLMLFLLYFLYLSIISVGQDFLSFGWELFLQEITLNCFFLSLTREPNLLVWISCNLLLFRFHFQAGAVKLQSKDIHWKDLSAIWYHYQSQPLPNTTAWYVYKLPLWFHKLSTLFMFIAELVVPFAIFFTEDMRLCTFVVLAGLQLMIWATGNFSYLNHLTLVLCLILVSNSVFEHIGISSVNQGEDHWFLWVVGVLLITLQLIRLYDHFRPKKVFRALFAILSPFHIVNRYGIFAVMTCTRYEIVIEGSHDGVVWKEYLFRYKPSEIDRRPRRISPYQPRLDWQAWFLPFTSFAREPWFQSFLVHLLKGTKEVAILLRHNPFADTPPRFVRALCYIYEYTSFEEKKKSGNWWKRRLVGRYSPELQLVKKD
jgi:hypothetical protein